MGDVAEVLIEVASFLGAIALLLGFIALGAFPTALSSLLFDSKQHARALWCACLTELRQEQAWSVLVCNSTTQRASVAAKAGNM